MPRPNTATISGPRLRPIPVTQRGGTSATAMATPAMELESRSRLSVKAPATAAATAITRSIRLGAVREVISRLTSLAPKTDANTQAVPTTVSTPIATVIAERFTRRLSAIVRPNARLRIGSISGATIMAPITTAVLLLIRPSVAITAAQTSSTKKPSDGFDELMRLWRTSSAGTLLSRFSCHSPESLSKACLIRECIRNDCLDQVWRSAPLSSLLLSFF